MITRRNNLFWLNLVVFNTHPGPIQISNSSFWTHMGYERSAGKRDASSTDHRIIPIQIQVRFHFDPNYVCAQLFFDRFLLWHPWNGAVSLVGFWSFHSKITGLNILFVSVSHARASKPLAPIGLWFGFRLRLSGFKPKNKFTAILQFQVNYQGAEKGKWGYLRETQPGLPIAILRG